MNHRHANVVVCHGGSGTAFGALAAGVPLIICPLFADQSSNGQLIASAGAGLVAAARALREDCAESDLQTSSRFVTRSSKFWTGLLTVTTRSD